MRVTGLLILIIGILGLVVGRSNHSRHRTVLEVGSLRATAVEQRYISLSGIVAGVVLFGGTLLFAIPRRRPD